MQVGNGVGRANGGGGGAKVSNQSSSQKFVTSSRRLSCGAGQVSQFVHMGTSTPFF